MGHLSLGEFSKPQSYHKAHGELVEVKKRLVHKDKKISKLAKRLQRLEEAQARKNQEEEEEWRLNNFDKRHHQHQPQPQHSFDFVKLPSFSGSYDPTLYLEWEAKVEHVLKVYKISEDQKVRLASLVFLLCQPMVAINCNVLG